MVPITIMESGEVTAPMLPMAVSRKPGTGKPLILRAAKYGADEDYASRCIVTTTILSLVTIPLLMLFL